jgi:hypothetical protein
MSQLEVADLAELLGSSWPDNSGIILYGSSLFEPVNVVNDIDVVVLVPYACRRRLIKTYKDKEIHINVLSSDVFLKDLAEARYGEYYLNKVMNPYCPLNQSAAIDEIATMVKKHRALLTFSLAYSVARKLSVHDIVRIATLMRVFQFPHYLGPAITAFSNTSSRMFIDLMIQYRQAVEALSVEGILRQETPEEFSLCKSPESHELTEIWERMTLAIPNYWRTFAEIHPSGWSDVNAYLKRHATKLQDTLKRHPEGLKELFNNSVLFDTAEHWFESRIAGGKRKRHG